MVYLVEFIAEIVNQILLKYVILDTTEYILKQVDLRNAYTLHEITLIQYRNRKKSIPV